MFLLSVSIERNDAPSEGLDPNATFHHASKIFPNEVATCDCLNFAATQFLVEKTGSRYDSTEERHNYLQCSKLFLSVLRFYDEAPPRLNQNSSSSIQFKQFSLSFCFVSGLNQNNSRSDCCKSCSERKCSRCCLQNDQPFPGTFNLLLR